MSPFENDKIITQSNTKEERLNYIIGYLGVSEHNQAIIYCLYPGYTETYAKNYCATLQEPIFPKQETLLFIEHLKANYFGQLYLSPKKQQNIVYQFHECVMRVKINYNFVISVYEIC